MKMVAGVPEMLKEENLYISIMDTGLIYHYWLL